MRWRKELGLEIPVNGPFLGTLLRMGLMREQIIKLGRLKLVAIITLVALGLTVALHGLLGQLFDNNVGKALLNAGIVPLLVAPLVSWYLVGVFFEVNQQERRTNELSGKFESEAKVLRTSEARLRTLIEGAPEAFFIHSLDGTILDTNEAACKQLGYTRDELLSASIFDLEVGGPDREKVINETWLALAARGSYVTKTTYRHKDGTVRPVEVNMTCVTDGDEKLVFALARDITETEKLKAHLSKLAMTDELTGIHNRRAFLNDLEKALSRATRDSKDVSVLMIDIDHFKKVNDRFGHRGGDVALQHFAETATIALRKGDTLGRLGGEEFAVLLPSTEIPEATKLAERLRQAIEDAFVEYGGRKISFTISIGVASFDDPKMDSTTLVSHADEALYRAKRCGRNAVMVYQGSEAPADFSEAEHIA